MLTIHVELCHGLFRGAPADDLALTGEADAAEWPPSPARLFAALVAGGGTGPAAEHGTAALELLEHAPPPVIRAVSRGDAMQNVINPRYAVIDKSDSGAVQNYPARVAQLVRPGVRVAPKVARIAYVWPELNPEAELLDELRYRAARVGYLGCSDSPARVWVDGALDDVEAALPTWEPGAPADHALSVPYPGFRDALDAAFEAWKAGQPVRGAWINRRLAEYRSPDAAAPSRPAPHCIWLRFDRPVRGRRVLFVAEALRRAVLARYCAVNGVDASEAPEVLSGHVTSRDRSYQHVHWLPLPAVGHRFADGRIRGACIWLPADTDITIVEAVRRSVAGTWRLHALPADVRPFDGAERPWASNPARWTKPSKHFVSAFPVVHERWTKRGPSLDDVAQWCKHADVPNPVWARAAEVPLLPGCAALRRHEVFREGAERRPYSHLAVAFSEPVAGPFALGRARQFGLGLMVPVDGSDLT